MEMVRVGVVGVGGMGGFHARTLATLARVDVVAVSDPHEPNASAIRNEVGAAIVDDPFELIASEAIDAVVIASPDDTHADFAIAALQRGMPVLCEKPLATSVGDARRVLDTEVALGRRCVQMGFMREYDPAHRQVRDELVGLGGIDYVRAVHRNSNTRRRPLDEIVGQSIVHDIHTLRHLTGADVTWVRASGSGPSDGSFRHIVAMCGLSNGAHAVIEFDDGGFAYEVTLEVLAGDGDVLTGPPTRPVRRANGSIDVHLGADWFGWFADAYRTQDEAWIESIRTGVAVGPSTWDGYAAQTVVHAILESLDARRTVEVATSDQPALYG